MGQVAVPHLCGGIFFDLLLETKKQRRKPRNKYNSGSDGLNIPDVYAGLIEIVTGENLSDSAGDALGKCATNYRKCEKSNGDYIPFTSVATRNAFKVQYESNRKTLYERTAKFIDRFLNKDKCIWLVSALIETMQNDVAIDDDMPIAINYSVSLPVKSLQTADIIVLLPFLLNVLSYVIEKCPDCESGKDTFLAWYSQSGSKAVWKFNNADLGKSIPIIKVDTETTFPSTTASVSDSVDVKVRANTSEIIPDREAIDNRILDIGQAMLEAVGAVEHQMAEKIRRGQKKKVPPTEEPTPAVTVVQNQTNIEHDESKTFNIKNSEVTINYSQGSTALIPANENGKPFVPLTPTRYDSKTQIIYIGTEEVKLPIQLTPRSTKSKQIPSYVNALCEVYSEKIKIVVTPDIIDTLPSSLRHNFYEQRKAYFSAEIIHRSVQEVFSDGEKQFKMLKTDAYNGISDIYFDCRNKTGYDRLMAVLDKITDITLSKSALINIIGLIANLEKKGICHMLVNDGTIKSWVNIDE